MADGKVKIKLTLDLHSRSGETRENHQALFELEVEEGSQKNIQAAIQKCRDSSDAVFPGNGV